MKQRLLLVFLVMLLVLLNGCETFRGLGKDMEKAGEWVQEKAQ
ncbi:entericidin A/B family lipoprotein [Pelobacter seleniigenes]|nr:entericidin A/B family lipoprotein [Pelobacter seleniigenes]